MAQPEVDDAGIAFSGVAAAENGATGIAKTSFDGAREGQLSMEEGDQIKVLDRAANSRGPGGPTGPLGTPSRTPWTLSR